MQTGRRTSNSFTFEPTRFGLPNLPAGLSQPAGGMNGLTVEDREIMPPWEGVAGLVWGRPAPLPLGIRDLAGPSFCSFTTLLRESSPAPSDRPYGREETLNEGTEIRRIRVRSALALWLLVGLWLFICL